MTRIGQRDLLERAQINAIGNGASLFTATQIVGELFQRVEKGGWLVVGAIDVAMIWRR
jgi:preprotein translocase subunit SecY